MASRARQGRFPYLNSGASGRIGTAPVRWLPANGFGLHETTGNTWEWTSTPWSDVHAVESPCGCSPAPGRTPPHASRRVVPTCARPSTACGIGRPPGHSRPSIPRRPISGSAACGAC